MLQMLTVMELLMLAAALLLTAKDVCDKRLLKLMFHVLQLYMLWLIIVYVFVVTICWYDFYILKKIK